MAKRRQTFERAARKRKAEQRAKAAANRPDSPDEKQKAKETKGSKE
ncbi:MAG: hypothetical protein KFH98_02020 [Gemmatimonadetes bacterium]|nr:hypothetical protein [Gemmatimonadota bacterium]